jgi:hypothetical protein
VATALISAIATRSIPAPRCLSRISLAMLVRNSRTSSANGPVGPMPLVCLLPRGYRVDRAFLLKSSLTVPVGAVTVAAPPPNPTVELDRSNWLAAKLDPQVASSAPGRHRLGPVSTWRCDHCRQELGCGLHRYWGMQFCSSACMTAYQQRLAPETKVKICRLDVLTFARSEKTRWNF